MDHVWSPWRYKYISKQVKDAGCVFCKLSATQRDAENFILFRGAHNFIVLNIFPYTSGHLMIVPYQHVAELHAVAKPISDEMMDLAKECQKALSEAYRPNGFNLGINLGEAAGAGIAEHLHLHVLPRWIGDANFTTTIGETRILPEDLETTYGRLKGYFL